MLGDSAGERPSERCDACKLGMRNAGQTELHDVGVESESGEVGAPSAAGLVADAVEVGSDGADADEQLLSDLSVRGALRYECQEFSFTLAEFRSTGARPSRPAGEQRVAFVGDHERLHDALLAGRGVVVVGFVQDGLTGEVAAEGVERPEPADDVLHLRGQGCVGAPATDGDVEFGEVRTQQGEQEKLTVTEVGPVYPPQLDAVVNASVGRKRHQCVVPHSLDPEEFKHLRPRSARSHSSTSCSTR